VVITSQVHTATADAAASRYSAATTVRHGWRRGIHPISSSATLAIRSATLLSLAERRTFVTWTHASGAAGGSLAYVVADIASARRNTLARMAPTTRLEFAVP
jgi:hypothetical protein